MIFSLDLAVLDHFLAEEFHPFQDNLPTGSTAWIKNKN